MSNSETKRNTEPPTSGVRNSSHHRGPAAITGHPYRRHVVTWKQLATFAEQIDRTPEHVYRVVRGQYRRRPGNGIEREFKRYFGFDMDLARFEGRKPVRPVTHRVDGTRIA